MVLYSSYLFPKNYLPSRQEVIKTFDELLKGNLKREDASNWTNQWIIKEHAPVQDFVVWDALMKLSGVDLLDIDGSYLHNEHDIISWLNDFQQGCMLNPEAK